MGILRMIIAMSVVESIMGNQQQQRQRQQHQQNHPSKENPVVMVFKFILGGVAAMVGFVLTIAGIVWGLALGGFNLVIVLLGVIALGLYLVEKYVV